MTGNIIPSDWDGVTFECQIIEWPASNEWRAIFNGLMTSPSRGRFWDGDTGSIIGAQSVGQQIIDRNYQTGSDEFMGCESISNAIQAMTGFLEAQGCCGGAPGTSGINGAGGSSVAGSTFVDDGIEFPGGYSDVADYHTGKCNLAQFLLDRWVTDLTNLSYLNLAGLTLASLIAGAGFTLTTVLLTPIPFDDLVVLGGILIAVFLSLGALQAFINQGVNYFSNLDICLLFDAETADALINDVYADIDAQTFAISDAQMKDVLKSFVTTDVINILFQDKPNLEDLPTGDCSGCGDQCEWQIAIGTGTIVTDGTEFTITSEEDAQGDQEIGIVKTVSCCPDNDTLTLVSWTSNPNQGFAVYEWASCPATNIIVNQAAPSAGTWQAMRIHQTEGSATPFAMTFTITP
jgi:hypothetical protein